MQQQIYKTELAKSQVLQAVANVASVFTPTAIKKTILKLKIHMQLFLGSCLGVKFPSLEANQSKLSKMEIEWQKT